MDCNCFFTTNLHLKKHLKRKHNSNNIKTPLRTINDLKNFEILPIEFDPDPILGNTIIKSESVENDISFSSDG